MKNIKNFTSQTLRHPVRTYDRFVFWWQHKRNTWQHVVDTDRKRALEIYWHYYFNTPLNLKSPKTLNEKVQWIEAFTDTSEWIIYTDKYEVRKYVEKCGFKDILLPLYGVWDNVEDIDFDMLPNRFAIKCTHDCGSTLLIHDKEHDFDKDKVKTLLKYHLQKPFGYDTCEPHYTKIQPRIMAEQLLPEETDESSSLLTSSSVDYKFLCFEGKALLCLVCYDRTIGGHSKKNIYTLNPWEARQDFLNEKKRDQDIKLFPPPKNLKRMVRIAETLSAHTHFMRVDLYNNNGKIYFGELTFAMSAGRTNLFTPQVQLLLGERIKLPVDKR